MSGGMEATLGLHKSNQARCPVYTVLPACGEAKWHSPFEIENVKKHGENRSRSTKHIQSICQKDPCSLQLFLCLKDPQHDFAR